MQTPRHTHPQIARKQSAKQTKTQGTQLKARVGFNNVEFWKAKALFLIPFLLFLFPFPTLLHALLSLCISSCRRILGRFLTLSFLKDEAAQCTCVLLQVSTEYKMCTYELPSFTIKSKFVLNQICVWFMLLKGCAVSTEKDREGVEKEREE